MPEAKQSGDFVFTNSFFEKKPTDFKGRKDPEIVALAIRDKKRKELADMDVSKEPGNASAISACKENLIILYGEKIVSQMPPVFIIPNYRLPYRSQGEFDPEAFASLVHVSKDMTLIELLSIHHEIEHSLGRVFKVFSKENKSKEQNGFQIGYSTSTAEGERRGVVLEEGLMQRNAIEFVSLSKNKLVTRLRNNEFRFGLFGSALEDGVGGLMRKMLLGSSHSAVESVHGSTTEEYKLAHELVGLLVKGAEASGGLKGRKDFIGDLVLGRVDPSARFRLTHEIDKVFGSGTARAVFDVKFQKQSVLDINTYLQAIIWKRYPNFDPQA